jgi:hypothetical protein
MAAEVPIAVAQAAIARALGAGQTKAGLARLIGRNSSLITQWQRGTKSLGGGRTQTFRRIDQQTADSLTRAADLAESRETVDGAAARPRRSGAGGRLSGVRKRSTSWSTRGKRQAVAGGLRNATARVRRSTGLALTLTMRPGTEGVPGSPVGRRHDSAVTHLGVSVDIGPGQSLDILQAVQGGQNLTDALVDFLTTAGVQPGPGQTIRGSILAVEARTWGDAADEGDDEG